MFSFFANSFFIEASQENIETKVDIEKAKLIPISKISEKFYDKDYSKESKEKQIESLKRDNQILREKINSIEASGTWKIMEPIRKIKAKIKK